MPQSVRQRDGRIGPVEADGPDGQPHPALAAGEDVLNWLFVVLRELNLIDEGAEVLGLDSISAKAHPRDGAGALANRAAGPESVSANIAETALARAY